MSPKIPDPTFLKVPGVVINIIHIAIQRVIQGLANNKSPGLDLIPVELLKKGDNVHINKLHSLVVEIWKRKTLTEEWNPAIMCPINENYKGISFLNTKFLQLFYIKD